MLTDKTILVRKHILESLERGDLQAGDRVPPARQLAVDLDATFLKVQQALETLVQDGILETKPRQGTFVREGWQKRLLHDNLSIFNYRYRLPWLDGLQARLSEALPTLRFTDAFPSSVIEYKVTMYVQQAQHRLLDLAEIFEECFPGEEARAFFDMPFEAFRIGERLVGIPFIYSPRVLYINPTLFRRAGLELPAADWQWEDLQRAIAALRGVLPANRILNWYVQPHLWMNLVKRAGGGLLHPEHPDRVLVNSPETKRGLALYRELGTALDNPAYDDDSYRRAFLDGEAAMVLAGRQFVSYLRLEGMDDWTVVPLPAIPGGVDVTVQSTDVICVRESCVDRETVCDYVRFMLSEPVQDYIADQGYGIPIRRSSAARALNPADPRDAVFRQEMTRLATEPAPACEGLMPMLLSGIDRILLQQDDIDAGTDALAQMANTMLEIHRFQAEQRRKKASGEDPIAVATSAAASMEMFR